MNNRLTFLLEKIQGATAEPGDYSELLALIQKEPSGETIDQITAFLQARIISISENTNENRNLREETINEVIGVCRRIDLQAELKTELETAYETFRIPLIKKRWFQYVAAAASVIMIGTGIYFFTNNSNEKPTITIQSKQDIPAGGNKAFLTLSNGEKIILDTAVNGTLARQGNTAIIKTDSGKIAYNASIVKPNNNSNSSEISYNTLTTPRGGQYQLTLPDGTKVWLNAASSITYPTAFTGKERKVSIAGEAYFEVVHNKMQPFEVEINGTQIHDIGTSFNINGYGDDNNIKTTLIEGSIKIETAKEHMVIKPGQQALTEPGHTKITLDKNVDIDKVMAWHNGKIILSNVSVEQIMREISRWYDVDIVYTGSIPQRQFYGSIRRDVKLSTVLNALKDYGVQTRIENRKIIVQ